MLKSNNKIYKTSININNKLKLILGIFVFRLILDYMYSEFIATLFRYGGFEYAFYLGKYVSSWFVLLIFIPVIIKIHNKTTLSSIIMVLLLYLSVIPFTTMIAFHPLKISYIVSNVIYWLFMIVLYRFIPGINLVRVKNDLMVNAFIYSVIFIFFLVIIYISWKFTGFRITFNLLNVYDLRREAITFRMPTIISYIYSASKAVNPILLIYFLLNKKYSIAGFIFFIQILSFSINGSKTVFFSTFLAVILYLFYNEKYSFKIPWFLSLVGILGIIEIYINKTYLIVSFVIRRVFFVPNLLNYYYFEFFSVNSPDYLKQSFLRHFGLESSYLAIDNLIGSVYFNRPDMGANCGLISDAFANFGILGLLIMPIVVVLALKILDACAKGLNIRIFIALGITLAFIFISSFFFTILLTHGLIALCVILYLLPRNNINEM